ncbi:MAG: DUF1512 domain-containing protein [Thermoprotei archaeon]|nr:MAG: DUF1512 domain-containing protein [Thermoprotei archaeon]
MEREREGCVRAMDGGGVLGLLTFMAILAFFTYLSRELEIRRVASEIELYLMLFKVARDRALSSTVRKFGELSAREGGRVDLGKIERRVRALIETVIITPEALDPFGIARKMRFFLRTADAILKGEVERIIPRAERCEVETLASMVEASRALNYVYKVVNHSYTLAKKFKSYWLLLQLDALLPFIAQEVRAYENVVDALAKQLPIGDSVGPLVVATLARELNAEEVKLGVEDTCVYQADFEGRRLLLIKAEGPGSNTGRLDEALRRVLAGWGANATLVVTIDAALKFEGERSGDVAEGYGVAIGGTGVEKYGIEEVLTEYGLKPYALLIKMSEEEALSPLSRELYEACLSAKERVKQIVLENSAQGDTVIIVGVGNTVGVA